MSTPQQVGTGRGDLLSLAHIVPIKRPLLVPNLCVCFIVLRSNFCICQRPPLMPAGSTFEDSVSTAGLVLLTGVQGLLIACSQVRRDDTVAAAAAALPPMDSSTQP